MATPARVRNVRVVNLFSQRRFLVEWMFNAELDIDHYNIYRSESQLSGYTLQGTASATTGQFLDTVPFTFGINYFWKVTAVNTADEETDLEDSEAVNDVTIGRFDEEPFKQITVQKTDLVYHEVPTGAKNGVNTVFTTANVFRTGSSQVYLNGVLQIPNVDYTENTALNGITFVSIVPISTDDLRLSYLKFV